MIVARECARFAVAVQSTILMNTNASRFLIESKASDGEDLKKFTGDGMWSFDSIASAKDGLDITVTFKRIASTPKTTKAGASNTKQSSKQVGKEGKQKQQKQMQIKKKKTIMKNITLRINKKNNI